MSSTTLLGDGATGGGSGQLIQISAELAVAANSANLKHAIARPPVRSRATTTSPLFDIALSAS
jgi:hypothetical protein